MKETARTRLVEERKRRQWSQQEIATLIGTTRPNVSRWEAGLTAPGPYFRAKLCALFGKSAPELGLAEMNPPSPIISEKETVGAEQMGAPQTDVRALWNVPYPRNPHFVGRDELLARLDQQFSPVGHDDPTTTRRAALTQPQAVKGLGGIGKTQIAVEYAYRSREQSRYTHTLWINAANEETIMTSLVTLAQVLPAFAAKNETDQQKLVEAIKRWLEQCQQRWLLIFDNADDVALLQPYLPQRGNGSLLLTTRFHAVGSLAASIAVENMGLMEGTQFLLHRALRQDVCDEERDEATNIVIALDGFPLALDQAGAYIEETGCGFGDYLQTYQEHHQALLARRGRQATNYPDSVATTWSLSFQHIAQTNPAAAELLHLCAFLAPDSIPEELLTDSRAQWPPLLQQAVADRLVFNHMLEDMLRFSLIKRRVEDRTLSIHRLVQVVQRNIMVSEEQRQWAELVVRAVHAVFPRDPKVDVTSWPQCLRYLEQAQACDTLIQQYKLLISEAAELLDKAGTYLSGHASYTLAELLHQRALQIWEHPMGPEHPQTAVTLNHLAELYKEQGKYEQAESLYQRALQILEQAGAQPCLQTASLLNGLAELYSLQRMYERAKPLFERALRIWEQTGGPEHFHVADPLNGLALLYSGQGKYTQAEPLYQRALQILEQALGPEHPQIAVLLNNLANLYVRQKKYEQAELLYQRNLQIWEQALGPGHPQIAFALNGLANLYKGLGKYAQAELSLERALQIWEQALGPEHPYIASVLSGLAFLYNEQEKYEQAEPLFERALQIWEQALGPGHPQIASALNGLANLYKGQEKYERAEPFYQHALRIWEQASGPDHPDLVFPLNGLATLYGKQGRYEEAKALYQRALSIRERTLGEHHLDTAETLYDFAVFQEAQNRRQEAVSLYQRALAIREQVLGREHPQTTDASERLRAVLFALERNAEVGEGDKVQPEPTETKDVERNAEVDGELRSVLPSCPHCQSNSVVVKSGTNTSGSLRFRCQRCQRYFTPQAAPRGYGRMWKEQAVILAGQGKSSRFIARQLGVNHRTIRAWVTAEGVLRLDMVDKS